MSRPREYEVRVRLTREQHEALARQAAERGISVGAVIREAIDRHLPPRTRSRREALEAIRGLELPVGDWVDMEREIIERAFR